MAGHRPPEIGTGPGADFWLDVGHFRRLTQAGGGHGHAAEEVCPQCLAELEEAIALYRGDFMEGFALRDSVALTTGSSSRRDAAPGAGHRAGTAGARPRGPRQPPGGPAPCRRRLALDPLHEPAHRQLMTLYAQIGQRSPRCASTGNALASSTRRWAGARRRDDRPVRADPGGLPAAGVCCGRCRARGRPRGTNLPAQATPFVGREQEVEEVRTRLQEPAAGC